jgi:hypothetical protein
MTTHALHSTPARAEVAREQLRSVGLAVRRTALLAGMLLLGVTALLLYGYIRAEQDPRSNFSFPFVPEVGFPLAMLALFLPMVVWKGEDPANRSYLWALPVERGWHQLAKNGSGWVWLMVAMAALLLWGLFMATVTGGDIAVKDYSQFIGEDMRSAQRGDWRRIVEQVPGWQWAVPFTAATIMYLIGSAVVLASNHPWRWYVGVVFGFMVLSAVLEITDWTAGERVMEAFFDGRYGLQTVLSGEANTTGTYLSRAGEARTWNADRPALDAWLIATALWMGVAGAGVWIAARFHREP